MSCESPYTLSLLISEFRSSTGQSRTVDAEQRAHVLGFVVCSCVQVERKLLDLLARRIIVNETASSLLQESSTTPGLPLDAPSKNRLYSPPIFACSISLEYGE